MFVSKINQINNKCAQKLLLDKENGGSNLSFGNSIQVCSSDAASALKAQNVSVAKGYTFVQNVNIPSLNLNGNLYILPNGQKCFVAKKDGPCVIKTFFRVGSLNEPDNLRGISHFIEHNLFNGSKSLKPTEFVTAVNTRGGNYNASTGFNTTDYYIHSPLHKDEDLETFIKIHADMLANPTFSDEMLEKEKGPVTSEIQMIEDNFSNVATNIALKNLFGIRSTSVDIIGGNVSNINNLTRQNVVDYYKKNYTPQNALTVVIGDVDEKKTMDLLSKHFAEFTSDMQNDYFENLVPIQKAVRTSVSSDSVQSVNLQLAFAGPKNEDNKTAVNALLIALAGYNNAKLTEALRKQNITIDSELMSVSNKKASPTAILFSTHTPLGKEEDVLKTIYEKIHEMSYIPVSDEELEIIKNKMRMAIKYNAESNMDIAQLLGGNFISKNSFNDLINAEKNINNLTANDIMNAAKAFLDLQKVSIATVYPKKESSSVSFTGKIKQTDIYTYNTPNNINLAIRNVPESKIYSMILELKTPTFIKQSPIALVLSNMLSKGTSLMSENDFKNLEDKNNIISNVSASYNSIKFSYALPKESMRTALENFNRSLFAPAITPENFEKAKQEIKNAYYACQKSASARAIESLYEGTPKAYSARKVVEDLDKLTFNDVVLYFNEFMKNPEFKVYACGNFSNNDALQQLYSHLSSIGQAFSPDINSDIGVKTLEKSQVVVEAEEKNQADIVQMFRIKETGNAKDEAAIALLNEILGGNSNSRLFNDLREKQKLAYRVHSNYATEDDLESVIALRILTTTNDPKNPAASDNLKKSLDGFKYHIDKLMNEQVTIEELEAAKLQLKSKLEFRQESTGGKNDMLYSSMKSFYKQNYLTEIKKAIDSITPEDIQTIAKYYLSKPSVISVIASKDTLNKNEEYLKSLGNLKRF